MKDIRILCVDDDRRMLNSLQLYMEMEGLSNSHFFSEWSPALTFINENPIDLLILDLAMPEINGYDALQAAKAVHPKLPVYMLSGINEVSAAVKCMKAGAEDYLLKPLDWNSFFRNVIDPLTQGSGASDSSHTTVDELRVWYENILNTLPADSFRSDLKRFLIEEKGAFIQGLTLHMLAEKVGSNTTYLSRFFNEYFSLSFPQWLRRVRIAHFVSKRGYSEEHCRYSVEGIGSDLGFQSRSTFYTACKSVLGVSPNEFLEG